MKTGGSWGRCTRGRGSATPADAPPSAPRPSPPAPGTLVVGLEVHAYLRTRSKMFCRCPADFLAATGPNVNICPVCTSQPGSKPMAMNRAAIEQGLRVARLVRCPVEAGRRVRTLRKHYFYPDLPSNYQRTMEPLATGGSFAGARIREVHLEEDPGTFELKKGLVDFNRSGAPLLEIVTEPDLRSAEEAVAFLEDLRLGLEFLGVGREGALFKADCNVSIAPHERIELKNLNSLENVAAAIAFEEKRQRAAIARGETIRRETRHFDETFVNTVTLRVKESEEDYRYFPDPDLPPLVLTEELIRAAHALAEEDPFELVRDLAHRTGADLAQVRALAYERPMVLAFAEDLRSARDPRLALEFFLRDIKGELHFRGRKFAATPLTAAGIASILSAIDAGRITRRVSVLVLRGWLDGGDLDARLAKEAAAEVPTEELAAAAADVVAAEAHAAADYRAGKERALHALVGRLLQRFHGRVRPEAAREAVLAALGPGGPKP